MNNIVSLSGGKDSTAMLLMMLEKKIKIDEIVFFDTTWDFPEMIEHINKLEKYIDREIIKLESKRGFKELFRLKGFPSLCLRWCTGEKRDAINKFCNGHKPFYQWLGYSFDEIRRVRKTIDHCYPLIDWRITEEKALKYCLDRGFDWGGLYEERKRVSCWCCPLQSLKSLKVLKKEFPEYWEKLHRMQGRSKWQFRKDYTITELEEKFKREEGKKRALRLF